MFAFANNVRKCYTSSYSTRCDVYAVLCVFQPKGAVFECYVVKHHQTTFVVLNM